MTTIKNYLMKILFLIIILIIIITVTITFNNNNNDDDYYNNKSINVINKWKNEMFKIIKNLHKTKERNSLIQKNISHNIINNCKDVIIPNHTLN